MKIYINKNFDGQPSNDEKISSFGFRGINKADIDNYKIFEKSLERYVLQSDRKGSLDKKVTELISLFNKSKNIEIIRKSSDGQDIRNFLKGKTIISGKSPIRNIRNIAFIARFDKSIQASPKANSIIFTFDMVKETQNPDSLNNPQIYFNLTSVDVLQMQNANYNHPKILKLNKVELVDFSTVENEKLLLSNQNISELSKLEKSLDIFGNKDMDQMRLKDFYATITSLNDFIKSKEKDTKYIYNIGQDNITVEDSKKAKLYLIDKSSYKFNTDKKREAFILGHKENNFKLEVLNYKILDLGKMFEDTKTSILDEIDSNKVLLAELETIIKNHKSKKLEILSILETEDFKLNELKNELKKLVGENKVLSLQLKEITKNIKNIDSEIKTTKQKFDADKKHLESQLKLKKKNKKNKNKNNSNTKHSNDENLHNKSNDYFNKNIEIKISDLQKEFSKQIEILDLKLVNFKKEKIEPTKLFDESNKKVSDMKNKILIYEDKIKSLENDLKVQKKQIEKNNLAFKSKLESISKLKKNINDLSTKVDELVDKDLALFEITVLGNYNKYLRNAVEKQELEAISFTDMLLEDVDKYTLSDYDAGLASVLRRYMYTLRAYKAGSFKSPYAALSLDKPGVEIEIPKSVKVNGLVLNEGQQKALNASAYAHYTSILQGPPGTGKTQVISAAISDSVDKGQNIIISSATNAAIDNAMERINKSTINPNIFMIRYSNNKANIEKHPEFSSKYLYKSFLDKMDRHVNSNNEIASRVVSKDLKKALLNVQFVNSFILDINYEELLDSLNNADIKKLFEYLKMDGYDLKYVKDDIIDETDKRLKRLKRNFDSELKLAMEYINKNYDINLGIVTSDISKLISENKVGSSTRFQKMILHLNSELNKNQPGYDFGSYEKSFSIKSDEFASMLFNNDLINVIGITTNSKLEFGVHSLKNETRELFSDYRVDFAIIDEVSKSITPEILSIAKLSNRFMFAGDYRQLPPQFELSEKLIEEFRKFVLLNSDSFGMAEIKLIAEKGSIDFKSFIDELFGNSLFVNQVEKMKSTGNTIQTSYEALKKQYRFNDVINDLVNLTYDTDEKLIPANKEAYKKYIVGNKKNLIEFATIIDTSYLTKEIVDKINNKLKEKVAVGDVAFDQKESLITNHSSSKTMNDYNALVIVKLIEDLYDKNSNIKDNDIGVIAMTRIQVKLISYLIRSSKKLKEKAKFIKVDTVDNFQGQEREIIILDLVRARNQLSNKKVKQMKKRNLDFYKKPERINVAISRAKAKVIIVGAFEDHLSNDVISEVKINGSVKKIKLFKKWVEIISKRGDLIPWDNY